MTVEPRSFAHDEPGGGGVLVEVVAVPRSGKTEAKGEVDGRLKVRLAAPPVDGLANDELVDFLARALSVKKSAVTLVRGESSKRKTVRIFGTTASAVRATLLPR